ncbi:MAG: hypothetical protein KDD51_15935 [Bdellovibrionales bacterium]|nr:hypothetical protein [Bdellovibrionales bacterium]
MKQFIAILVVTQLIACSVLERRRPVAAAIEYSRPSNPAFLGPVTQPPKVSVSEMDFDLSRRYWLVEDRATLGDESYRYEVVVTPITAPLIDRMLREEALKKNSSMREVRTTINNLTRALVRDQSCFEIFVKAPSLIGQEYRVDYYAVTYHPIGVKPIPARPLLAKTKYSSVVGVARELIDSYLPVGVWDGDQRNVRGVGYYSRQILCGPPINLQQPFQLHILPRYDLSLESKVMEWHLPPATVAE